MAIDNQENIVVVGETTDGISQLTFVRKYNPTGNILWEHQFSKDVSTIGFSVAVDNKGNILIVGGTAANFSKNSPENDLFIHKYDSQGNILWERNFNTLTRHPVNGRGDLETKVTADTLGNIFITGQTNLGLDDNNFSGSDVYLWKCDSDGNVLWTRQLGTSTTAHATGLATDNMNNIVLVGSTENKLSDSRGEGKAFIRKFNPNGTILWTRQFSFGASYNVSGGVTLDSLGNIIISGSTLGGNKNGQVTTYDAFTEKFDPNGDVLWEHFIGTNRPDTALSIATDEANNILITGTTEGNLEGKNNGNTDVFLRKLQP